MSHIVFEQLEKAGFIRGSTVKRSAIEHASAVDILDLAHESCELTSAIDLPKNSSVLAHSASLSLSGGRWPCSALDCRRNRAEKLAHFAALYGDLVYMRNLFCDYLEHMEHEQLPDEAALRTEFAEDLELLAYLRPLIESRIIIPVTPPHYCLGCLAKKSLGHEDDKQLSKAFGSLVHRMENEIDASVGCIGGKLYTVEASGPDDLLEHGFHATISETPPRYLAKMPRISARVRKGESVHLSKRALRNSGIASDFASDHCWSIVSELTLAAWLKTAILTEMPLHVALIKQLSSRPLVVERDLLVEKHLRCLVPFLKELSPAEILKIRESENDSFIFFKSALAQAIDEYRKNYGRFDEADARALYSDILRPRLTELESKLGKARRSLIKGSVRKVLAWTGAISFGVYTGLLPQGLAAVAAALGLTKIFADFTEDLMSKSDIEESARGHKMYFLWKIKKMTRSK